MGQKTKRNRTRRNRCVHLFFSSRRRHTRSKRDWSSDVCSSDLRGLLVGLGFGGHEEESAEGLTVGVTLFPAPPAPGAAQARAVTRVYSRRARRRGRPRSEERRGVEELAWSWRLECWRRHKDRWT